MTNLNKEFKVVMFLNALAYLKGEGGEGGVG